jgi:hypothetical protein
VFADYVYDARDTSALAPPGPGKGTRKR